MYFTVFPNGLFFVQPLLEIPHALGRIFFLELKASPSAFYEKHLRRNDKGLMISRF